MTVQELIELLEKVSPEAEVYIAPLGDLPLKAGNFMCADYFNEDGELSFMGLGMAFGDKAVLIEEEEIS